MKSTALLLNENNIEYRQMGRADVDIMLNAFKQQNLTSNRWLLCMKHSLTTMVISSSD